MGHYHNISPEEKTRLDRFRSEKLWKEWISTLHRNTKRSYESGLFTLLGRLQLTPGDLVQLASNPETQKDLSKRVKIVFAQLAQEYSYSARNIMLSAFNNYLAFNELLLPLTGFKLKLERKVKPLFTWEDAERTISRASDRVSASLPLHAARQPSTLSDSSNSTRIQNELSLLSGN